MQCSMGEGQEFQEGSLLLLSSLRVKAVVLWQSLASVYLALALLSEGCFAFLVSDDLFVSIYRKSYFDIKLIFSCRCECQFNQIVFHLIFRFLMDFFIYFYCFCARNHQYKLDLVILVSVKDFEWRMF